MGKKGTIFSTTWRGVGVSIARIFSERVRFISELAKLPNSKSRDKKVIGMSGDLKGLILGGSGKDLGELTTFTSRAKDKVTPMT